MRDITTDFEKISYRAITCEKAYIPNKCLYGLSQVRHAFQMSCHCPSDLESAPGNMSEAKALPLSTSAEKSAQRRRLPTKTTGQKREARQLLVDFLLFPCLIICLHSALAQTNLGRL